MNTSTKTFAQAIAFTAVAAAIGLIASQTNQPEVVQLPRVVVVGQATPVVKLPTVVITGKHVDSVTVAFAKRIGLIKNS